MKFKKNPFASFVLRGFWVGIALASLASCKSENPQTNKNSQIDFLKAYKEYKNLNASSGEVSTQGKPSAPTNDYVKFSFAKGDTTTGEDWDIAFRRTDIIVNGGHKVDATDANEPERTGEGALWNVDKKLIWEIKDVDPSQFHQDAPNAFAARNPSEWYSYDGSTHKITPVNGRVVVVKTHDGKYAKMIILSYYKNANPNPNLEQLEKDARYYTFKYVYTETLPFTK